MPLTSYRPNFQSWLELHGRELIGRQRAEILRTLESEGSITFVAKRLGLSYAFVWNQLSAMERLTGKKILNAYRGGREGGGGARLTDFGRELLAEYESLDNRLQKSLEIIGQKFRRRRNLFSHNVQRADLEIIGSDCPGLDFLLQTLHHANPSLTLAIANVGSLGGLAAIMLGEADVAGVHLLDMDTGKYNLPFLWRFGIQRRGVLVRGYRRKQGLLVKRGNPKGIRSFTDLLRREVKFINRNPASGTRSLLDMSLRKTAEKLDISFNQMTVKIRGYNVEVTSHSEVGKAIASGRVDVGLGIQTIATTFGLDFVPVAEESFDFVFNARRLRRYGPKMFLNALRSNIFRSKLPKVVSGYSVPANIGEILYRP